ncbi:MAG: CpsD/CapB family tyrosine-protein kinase [Gammaproteobacteria bacterium]|nr:CpsD/CapB family tyrosine-protein kinase [Gammaproteobacteria bacterium]
MEKIKQALERARNERAGGSGHYVDLDENDSPVKYSTTQAIKSSNKIMQESRISTALGHDNYTDAFNILGIQVIQRMEEHRWTTLAITSPTGGEGKTTAAINLAISIAKEVEYSVILVDANLRNPKVHEFFGVQPKYGLCDYLRSDIELSDVLYRPEEIEHFIILPGGVPLLNSSEMMGSPKMCGLVETLKDHYPKRIILFVLPPVLGTADAMSIAPCIDASLIVIEDDVTKESDLKQAVDILSVTNIIGTVLNKSIY